jgi:hypothetical protein
VTEEDKKALADEIADALSDIGPLEGAGDRDIAARLIVARIEHALYQQGWMPPRTYENVQGWAVRTVNIPDHHVNRDVLTSHLTELAAILHDR